MSFAAESPLARQVAGALDWWRTAGVDLAFTDEPQAWIVEEQQALAASQPAVFRPPVREEPRIQVGGAREAWPQSHGDFAAWWLGEPSLDQGPPDRRVPPRGVPGAALLVLVEQPEEMDQATLLSGPDGALLNAFLDASGVDSVYFASVLPRHMPHPDWATLAEHGLGEVLRHHLSLASPQRILAFGGNILPLLGHDPAKSPETLLQINPEGPQVATMVARDLAAMRARPAWKAALWRRWLDWTG